MDNLIQSSINKIKQTAGHIFQNGSQFVQNEAQSLQHPAQFAKTVIPNIQQPIQNFGQYHPQAAQQLIKTQPGFDRFKPIIRPAQQASAGIIDSSTLGLYDQPNKPELNSMGDKLAYGVGFGLGLVNPLNPVNKLGAFNALDKVGKAVINPLTERLAGKATGKIGQFIANKAIPAIGGELSQTVGYSAAQYGANKAGLTGNELTPESFGQNMLMGLGMRGAIGKIMPNTKSLSNKVPQWHPEDVNTLDRANEIIKTKKGDINAARQAIFNLADQYLKPEERPDNTNVTKMIQALQKKTASMDVPYQNIPGMGITGAQAQKGNTNVGGKYTWDNNKNKQVKSPVIMADLSSYFTSPKDIEENMISANNADRLDGIESFFYDFVSGERNKGKTYQQIYNDFSNGKITNDSPIVTNPIVEPKTKVVNGKVKVKMVPIKDPKTVLPQTLGEKPTITSEQGGSFPPQNLPNPVLDQNSYNPSITEPLNPQEPFYNVNKVGVNDATKQDIKTAITSPDVKAQIDTATGKPLTFSEVQAQAKISPVLDATKTRQATLDLGAQALALRQKVADLSNKDHPLSDDQFTEALIKDKAFGTYIARLLGQRRIVSNPADKTLFNTLISKILKEGHSPEDVVKAAKGVDFNNKDQATIFYRTFIKTKPGDWVDLVRYNSMLSSPNTHFNNAFSNWQGTGALYPVQKTIEGVVDAFHSAATNTPRTRLTGEGLSYAKGYATNVGNAWSGLVDVLKGKQNITNPDIRSMKLSTGKGLLSKSENILGVAGKALEGMDIFFRTMTEGGLKSAYAYRSSKLGASSIKNINVTAEADKMLYRGALVDKSEGILSNGLGSLAQIVSSASRSDNVAVRWSAKLSLPFINTGTNLAKKGIEHNPILGTINLVGTKDKTAATAKIIMGAAMTAAAVPIAAAGHLTFGYPTSQKEKDAYIAAGMQPYSVKIGNHWVSYAKMDPAIGFQLATVAGVYQALENKKITESNGQAIMAGAASGLQFIANQTYFKNIGDLMSAIQGSGNALQGMTRLASNYPAQFIPFRALLGWTNRMIDTYQRSPDTSASIATQTMQNLVYSLPGLSQALVPIRKDSKGNPVLNTDRALNAFSPLRVTTENPDNIPNYENIKMENDKTANLNALSKQVKAGKAPNTDTSGLTDMGNGDQKFINKEGSVQTINLNPPSSDTGLGGFVNSNWANEKAVSIWKDQGIPDDVKNNALKTLGMNPADVLYAGKASYSTDIKSQYVASRSTQMDHDTFINELVKGRVVSITGDQFASNGVLDNLYDQGVISKDEQINLKRIKVDKTGKSLLAAKGGISSKARLAKIKAISSKLASARGPRIVRAKKARAIKTPRLRFAKASKSGKAKLKMV